MDGETILAKGCGIKIDKEKCGKYLWIKQNSDTTIINASLCGKYLWINQNSDTTMNNASLLSKRKAGGVFKNVPS